MEELKQWKVSVLIPAYNEERTIAQVIEKTALAFSSLGIAGELVLVNDGSTDKTLEEANRHSWVKIYSHRIRRGLTEALKTGFRHVTGDVIVFLPADMEADPEQDIPTLLTKLAEGNDMVLGWRQGKRDNKKFASAFYNYVCRILFGLQAHDMNWVKAFRREVMENLHLRSDWHRFMAMIAVSQGYKIAEVPTSYHKREKGRSKFGFWRIPVSFLDVVVLRFLLTFSRKPMRFFGLIGIALISGALVIGAYLIYEYFFRFTQIRPLFNFGMIMALAGLLLFLVGFLAELIIDQQDRIEEIEDKLARKTKQ